MGNVFFHGLKDLAIQTTTVKYINEQSSSSDYKREIKQLYYLAQGKPHMMAAATIISIGVSNNTDCFSMTKGDLEHAIRSDPNHFRLNNNTTNEVVITDSLIAATREMLSAVLICNGQEELTVEFKDGLCKVVKENQPEEEPESEVDEIELKRNRILESRRGVPGIRNPKDAKRNIEVENSKHNIEDSEEELPTRNKPRPSQSIFRNRSRS